MVTFTQLSAKSNQKVNRDETNRFLLTHILILLLAYINAFDFCLGVSGWILSFSLILSQSNIYVVTCCLDNDRQNKLSHIIYQFLNIFRRWNSDWNYFPGFWVAVEFLQNLSAMTRENSKVKKVSDHETNQMLRCLCIGVITLIVFLSLPHLCSTHSHHDHDHGHDHGHDHHHHHHDEPAEPASFKW